MLILRNSGVTISILGVKGHKEQHLVGVDVERLVSIVITVRETPDHVTFRGKV